MSPKGGIRPHKRFSVQSNRSEVLFVDYMAEHLTPNGRAAIIVPEGIIFQSGTPTNNYASTWWTNYLWAVVSLPAGIFQPYSGVKTSILLLDRALAKKTDAIAFFKVENDGFGLGAQRREIDKNDLPETARLLREWMNHGIHGTHGKTEEDMSGSPSVSSVCSVVGNGLIVPKERDRGEWGIHPERGAVWENGTRSSEYPHGRLGDVCNINFAKPRILPNCILVPFSTTSTYPVLRTTRGSSSARTEFLLTKHQAGREGQLRKTMFLSRDRVRPNLKAFTILREVPERAIASTGFAVLAPRQGNCFPDF